LSTNTLLSRSKKRRNRDFTWAGEPLVRQYAVAAIPLAALERVDEDALGPAREQPFPTLLRLERFDEPGHALPLTLY